ncbi:MAG: alpha/beta fold hydrolase [Deltaproteobacteria bacterium]|nr:alpha/beta fold hydrolase [Deltaproteobacteria bacterium]
MTVPPDRVVPGRAEVGVLLLHGLTGTSAEMAPVAAALAGRYPLWSARIAGHETSVEDLAASSWEDWYASAAAGADALLRVAPRIVVVGLSMGAMLAMRLGVERREAVAGVALLSPAIELGRPWLRRLRLPFGLLAAADAGFPPLRRWLAALAMTKGGSDIADLEVRNRHPGYRQVPLRALLNLLRLQGSAWDAAPALTQPALVVHAANDHTCPLAGAERLFARLGSSAKRMVVLQRSFHVVTVDCERDRVLAALDAFLAAVHPSSTSSEDIG